MSGLWNLPYDFDILNSLEDEHLIGGSTHKAKSTYLTEEGLEKVKFSKRNKNC
ncbi:MAG: hypothetical protein HFJ37_02305 [Clostridia bacterium]|nr:hypothetical protein [Clostridia bacterium]